MDNPLNPHPTPKSPYLYMFTLNVTESSSESKTFSDSYLLGVMKHNSSQNKCISCFHLLFLDVVLIYILAFSFHQEKEVPYLSLSQGDCFSN